MKQGLVLAVVLATALPQGGVAMAAAASAPAAATATEDARLTRLLDKEFEGLLALSPEDATRFGSKVGQDRWEDISEAGQRRQLEWRRGSVARLKAGINRARLSPEAQVSYDIWVGELDRAELQYRYRAHRPPFANYLRPIHSALPNFLIGSHAVNSASDMKAWTARVRGLPAVYAEALAQSRTSSAAGIRAPRFAVERVIAASANLTRGAPFGEGADSPLWADAKTKVGKLAAAGKVTPAQADALLAEAKAAIAALKPSYDRIDQWARAELPTAPEGRVGAGSLPDGAAFYASTLKLSTTTDLTAEQIHQIGLAEVARIRGEQDALARSAGFADHAAFEADRAKRFPLVPWTDALRTDYLARANAAISKTRAAMPRFFQSLPAYAIEVQREPLFSEVPGGAAHASEPSPDGARPGRVYVHMLGDTWNFAAIPDLMCHEGAPGHVAQLDIQVRQKAGPRFRGATFFGAYIEGWGLYAEALCKEMGVYAEPAEDYARLNSELFRAMRLVVDTGLHAKGWSEEEAVAYMVREGSTPPQQARAEVRRYITNPGQATSYKVGMLKIVELRRRAEQALGDRFDIRAFHELLVGSGAQPLDILERRVDAWIASHRA